MLHLHELVPRHVQQLAVARERGVQPAGRDGVEGHHALPVGVGAAAAHPRLDDRLADQPRGAHAFFEKLLPRQRHALRRRAGKELARRIRRAEPVERHGFAASSGFRDLLECVPQWNKAGLGKSRG
ncbi:hypothetical protein D9M69_601270 [compost metagenome]